MNQGISVIVCCYNSASRLPASLAGLASQEIPDNLSCEIILVDNASTDNTQEIAARIWAELGTRIPLKLISQPIPGLTYAREKGISESSYDILLFCDDDNGLHPQYVATVFEVMSSNQNIGALGGCGILTSSIPSWLKKFEEFYAIGPQGSHSGDVTNTRGCLYGAGLAIRRDVLERLKQLDFQSILSDRTKKSLLSGGDTELTYAIRLAGYKLWYDERLKFNHFISPDRLERQYFYRLMFFIGYSWMALSPYHSTFNSQPLNYPNPNWKDSLYIVRRIFSSIGLMILSLVRLRMDLFRRNFYWCLFYSGELYFTLKNYGHYNQQPLFIRRMTI